MFDDLFYMLINGNKPILVHTSQSHFEKTQAKSVTGKLIKLFSPHDYSELLSEFDMQVERDMHHVQIMVELTFEELGFEEGKVNAFFIGNFLCPSEDNFNLSLLEILTNKCLEVRTADTLCLVFVASE